MSGGDLERITEGIDARCRKDGWEWTVELVTATDCGWQCTLTVVLTPNRAGPDRSLVTFAVGADPAAVFEAAWEDMRAWLSQSDRPAPRARRGPTGHDGVDAILRGDRRRERQARDARDCAGTS